MGNWKSLSQHEKVDLLENVKQSSTLSQLERIYRRVGAPPAAVEKKEHQEISIDYKMRSTSEPHHLWANFLKQWPMERLHRLTLEEYTNLKTETDDYFCHWVERKTADLGSIQGGTSSKFGIYLAGQIKETLRSGLTTDGRYIWWDQLGSTAEEAFEDVKRYVIKIAESSARGDHTLPLHNHLGPMFQLKIRFLYQSEPHQVLTRPSSHSL